MVRKPGSKHSAPSSRVTARRNDWNSIRVLHQGPRPPAASRGRIHDRSPIRLPKHQKSLADRGPSIHVSDPWLRDLLARRPYKVVMVALAAETARIIWAMLAKGEPYRGRASALAAA